MTEQEKINEALQRQIDAQNARIDNVLAKVDMLVIESQQQREDIRRAQEKHDADIKAMDAKFDAKFDAITKQINDTWKQTMIGVGGMIIALGALLITALK